MSSLKLALLFTLCVVFPHTLLSLGLKKAHSREVSSSPAFSSQSNGVERWFSQTVDHFDGFNTDTFQQKWIYNDSFWSGANDQGPILFIAGGEGPVTNIMYPFVVSLAQSVGGLLLTAEHRFYGDSVPYSNGQGSYQCGNTTGPVFQFLTVEQALADYQTLIRNLTDPGGEFECKDCPVAVFGGSYPGELAVYARMRYPGTFDMALGASAPIYFTSPSLVNKYDYFEVVTQAAFKLDNECPSFVQRGYNALLNEQYSAKEISDGLGLCDTLNSTDPSVYGPNTMDDLLAFLFQAFADYAMSNYPPQISPYLDACQRMMNESWIINGDDRDIFYRLLYDWYSPSESCLSLYEWRPDGEHATIHCSDLSGCGNGPGGQAWDWQACFQMIEAMATSGNHSSDYDSNDDSDVESHSSMFPKYDWNPQGDWFDYHCQQRFGLSDALNRGSTRMSREFGLDQFPTIWAQKGTSRIIFSNGRQDPWHVGSNLESFEWNDIISIVMDNGAHHSDMRGPSEFDTMDVIQAREQETKLLSKWIDEVKRERRTGDYRSSDKGNKNDKDRVSVDVFVVTVVCVASVLALLFVFCSRQGSEVTNEGRSDGIKQNQQGFQKLEEEHEEAEELNEEEEEEEEFKYDSQEVTEVEPVVDEHTV